MPSARSPGQEEAPGKDGQVAGAAADLEDAVSGPDGSLLQEAAVGGLDAEQPRGEVVEGEEPIAAGRQGCGMAGRNTDEHGQTRTPEAGDRDFCQALRLAIGGVRILLTPACPGAKIEVVPGWAAGRPSQCSHAAGA
jgi:hypothetical protein